MNGFLLLNQHYQCLTRYLKWGNIREAGWVWSNEQVNAILQQAAEEQWKEMPVIYQEAYWDPDQDNVFATADPAAL